jgi:hypothetical protein
MILFVYSIKRTFNILLIDLIITFNTLTSCTKVNGGMVNIGTNVQDLIVSLIKFPPLLL